LADDRVIFEIRAENDQLKSKLAESQTELDKLKAKAEAADASGLGFRQSVSAVKQWIGSVTAAIGVATTFFLLGQKIRDVYDELFTSGAEKARKFSEALMTTEPTERLKKYSDEIDVLQSRLAASSENVGRRLLNIFSGNTTDSLLLRVSELEKKRSEAQKQLNAQRDAEERAAEKKKQEEAVAAAIELQRVVGLERAKKRYDEVVKAEDAAQAVVDASLAAAKEAHERRLADAEKEGEAFARAAAAGMQQVIDQINRANESFFSSFADRQNGLLLSIRQEITRIRGSIPSSGGAAGFGSGGSY